MLNKNSHIDVNEKQRLASDPQNNVYVSASAGSGKTKVLSDRVLRLMLAGSKIEHILCLTFTNAAAAEMSERILGRLKNWLIMPESELSSELNKLSGQIPNEKVLARARQLYGEYLESYGKIKIQTIHSLCSTLMGQDPDNRSSLKVIDDYRKKILIKKSVEYAHQLTEKNVVSARKKLSKYFDYPTITKFFHEIVNNKIKFLESRDNEISIYNLYGADKHMTPEDLDAEFIKNIPTNLQSNIVSLNEIGEKLAARFMEAIDPFNLEKYIQCFYTQAGSPYKKFVSQKTLEIFPEIADFFEIEIARIENYKVQRNALISATFDEAFKCLMNAIFDKYEALKIQECLIDYDDFLIMTLRLLRGGNANNILYNLDYVIDHMLVDEAQDLSPMQWDLIKIISEEFFSGSGAKQMNRTIFIVGDYKQSIYSFQGADPKVFLDIKNYFSNKIISAKKNWTEVELNTSFRTTSEVLTAVDEIFNDKIYKECLGVDGPLSHIPFRNGGGCVQLWPLTEKIAENDNDGWAIPRKNDEESNPKKILALEIANHIKNWLKSGRFLLGHERPIQPKDIMILFQKRSDAFYYVINELKKCGVDVSDADRFKINEEIIIQDIISALKFICYPDDDLNLACLLKSPFIGISEEELYDIAYPRDSSLIREINNKFPQIRSKLNELTRDIQNYPLDDFLIKLLQKYKEKFLARFGEKTLKIFSNFLEVLKNYTFANPPGIHNFIDYIENSNIEIKIEVGQKENKVRVMTAHNSKGLQAPVVILADTSTGSQKPHTNLLWNDSNLFFTTYKEFDTPYLSTLKEITKQKEIEENARLLYVAMTRAEDELYITGWQNRRQNESWYSIFEDKITTNEIEYKYSQTISRSSEDCELPSFLREKISNLSAGSQILKATKSAETKTPEIIRGEEIHNFLNILTRMNPMARSTYLTNLKNNQSATIANSVIDNFPQIFTANSMPEIAFMGKIDGKNVSVKMDNITISENVIIVTDFKTGQRQQNKYNDQMNLYKKILEKKYPTKKVKSQILWVDSLELEQI